MSFPLRECALEAFVKCGDVIEQVCIHLDLADRFEESRPTHLASASAIARCKRRQVKLKLSSRILAGNQVP